MELFGFAQLTDAQLQAVRAFEAETGKRILVLRALRVRPAELTTEELTRLEALESELGDIVLAVR